MQTKHIYSLFVVLFIIKTTAFSDVYTGVTKAPEDFENSNITIINRFFDDKVAEKSVESESLGLQKKYIGMPYEKLLTDLNEKKKTFGGNVTMGEDSAYLSVIFKFLYIEEDGSQIRKTVIYNFKKQNGSIIDAWRTGTTGFFGKSDRGYDTNPQLSAEGLPPAVSETLSGLKIQQGALVKLAESDNDHGSWTLYESKGTYKKRDSDGSHKLIVSDVYIYTVYNGTSWDMCLFNTQRTCGEVAMYFSARWKYLSEGMKSGLIGTNEFSNISNRIGEAFYGFKGGWTESPTHKNIIFDELKSTILDRYIGEIKELKQPIKDCTHK